MSKIGQGRKEKLSKAKYLKKILLIEHISSSCLNLLLYLNKLISYVVM